CLQYKSFPYIF
nr:immunoglobulin light chain junction region [Macaca mulatta]